MTRDYKELLRCLRVHSEKMNCAFDNCICWDADKRGFGTCSEELAKLAADAIEELLPFAQPETPPYVTEIKSEYEKWVRMPHINKPLAKALYEVWKRHDREDVSRNG